MPPHKVPVLGQRIDPVHFELASAYGDIVAAFVNKNNPTIKPTIASFFMNAAGDWKTHFERAGWKVSSERVASAVTEANNKMLSGKGSGIILQGNKAKKAQNLQEARSKRQPKSAMRTPLAQVRHRKVVKSASVAAGDVTATP